MLSPQHTQKKTHTDQYLNFASHHLRTRVNRCETITSEEGNKKEEEEHSIGALRMSGYASVFSHIYTPLYIKHCVARREKADVSFSSQSGVRG